MEGIPITSPARTLYDLTPLVGSRELERALARALADRLTTPNEIRALVRRYEGRAGARRLEAVFAGGQPALTRSEAEERFLGLVRRARLETPEVNVEVGGYEVDFFWRRERLVVEVDGYAFHASPQAFERDRLRDSDLGAREVRVLRTTWRELVREPEAVLVRVAQALARSARNPP